ncbi:hypothetical protein JCM10450v2_001985 [Rhodotorula kratochvilovae]
MSDDHAGGGAIDGLGITFDAYPAVQQHPHVLYQPPHPAHPIYAAHLQQHRALQHSISYDEGLNQRLHAQPMLRYPSDVSGSSSHKRVRIAAGTPEVLNGKGGYLPYDQHHLSPLSDFGQSSTSETGSSQPFSPASLSSLPSSTDSGAYPSFQAHALPSDCYPIRNHPHAASHTDLPYAQPQTSERASRLPAFLQERQRGGVLARPKSMMELRESQRMSPLMSVYAPYAEHLEHAAYQPVSSDAYEHLQDSPESLPSSAGAMQRRQFERQLHGELDERRRMRASEGRPRERTHSEGAVRPLVRVRSRSLSAREMKELAERETAREQEEKAVEPVQNEREVVEDDAALEAEEADDEVGTVISLAPPQREGASGALQRQSTLLTAGASTVRRRKELDRLLAPTGKHIAISSLGAIAHSPTPSTSSSAVTTSTHQRTASRASTQATSLPSPVVLEQAKNGSRARVELDLALETPLVVEGGLLKGRLEVRIRKNKEREGEVWIGTPKIRVIGFEELSSGDGRYIFYHASSPASSSSDPLSCYGSPADGEGFHLGKVGQHNVPVKMSLPIGKGAKGPWKGKQGVVRYIAIASVKLKAQDGADRSIAHFYRHVEVYPYFNPALTLAPSVKPLTAEGAKSLFMGGSGLVTLRARLHRETWVAGQRCYVEVQVKNETSKKIKALTLSLIRTTSVHRSASRASSHTSRDPYGFGVEAVPAPASEPTQTQTTRKKVAETTLELGKKGTKGVTAKGSWLGVEAGEAADFSPSFLIPEDALSISRGRHLEISYSVKVSVGGSLSADVSVDIPIRVINFVSLDPPPGHVGPSPVPEQTQRPIAKSWSSNQLRDAVRPSTQTTMNRMSSVDSLRLEDLNGGRVPARPARPPLSRIASLDSIRTDDLGRGEPAQMRENPESRRSSRAVEDERAATHRSQGVVDRAKGRQLQHQMSLQCISSAIASATARRGVVQGESSVSTLRTAASHGDLYESSILAEQAPAEHFYGGVEEDLFTLPEGKVHSNVQFGRSGMGIQLDELDEVPDDPAFFDRRLEQQYEERREYAIEQLAGHIDAPSVASAESDDELDTLLQSHFSEDEDEQDERPISRHGRVPVSPRRSEAPPRAASPVKRAAPAPVAPASPVKASPSKRASDKFAFATPTSPVKANGELPVVPEHDHDEHTGRAARPLPTPPVVRAPVSSPAKARSPAALDEPPALRKTPSGASLKRNPGILRKSASTRSIRSAVSPAELSGAAPAGDVSRALVSARSPSIASPRVSPILASGTTAKVRPSLSPVMATPSSPARRVVKTPSPSLRPTRSMAELRNAPTPSSFFAGGSAHDRPVSPRKSTVLPSVKNKVAALETRQQTLSRLATTVREGGRVRVPVAPASSGAHLSRADSVLSSASSVMPSEFNLGRVNSMASFKAPLLKRGVSVVEEVPPVPTLPYL